MVDLLIHLLLIITCNDLKVINKELQDFSPEKQEFQSAYSLLMRRVEDIESHMFWTLE